MSPRCTCCPTRTIGRWLKHVPWFVRTNLWRRYIRGSAWSSSTMISVAVTERTVPLAWHTTTWPEALAARSSMPVPIGGEVRDLVSDEHLDLDLLHAGAGQLPRDLAGDLGAGVETPDILAEHAPQKARIADGELAEDAAVWRLDEAVWIDAAVARE